MFGSGDGGSASSNCDSAALGRPGQSVAGPPGMPTRAVPGLTNNEICWSTGGVSCYLKFHFPQDFNEFYKLSVECIEKY